MQYADLGWNRKKNMKVVLAAFIALIAIPVFAQNHFVGIQGGVGWTDVIADNSTLSEDLRQGINAGLTYEYHFRKRFHLGAEMTYAQRGFTNSIFITDQTGNVLSERAIIKWNYDYLSVPVKGGFHLGNEFRVFLNLALVPSLLLRAETIAPSVEVPGLEVFDVTDRVNAFDLAGLIEAGAGFRFHDRMWASASFIFQESITPFTNQNYFQNANGRHRGMAVLIGIKYALSEE